MPAHGARLSGDRLRGPAGAAKVPTYALVYPDLGALLGVRNVCNGDLLDALASRGHGDRQRDLRSDAQDSQRRPDAVLTLACAGSAAAKMRLMNYGPHADFDGEGLPATAAQRQATLKMLTADYCGTGHSYTANGTPLQWENQDGTVAFARPPRRPEAIWTAAGAVCLDATRLPSTPTSRARGHRAPLIPGLPANGRPGCLTDFIPARPHPVFTNVPISRRLRTSTPISPSAGAPRPGTRLLRGTASFPASGRTVGT